MTNALEVTNLVKTYRRNRALDGVDLMVEQGSVFGFLGANGSGKTTAIRIILGLARQNSGRIRVLGHKPGSDQIRSLIGYCPDVPGFLPWMTAMDVLESSAKLFRLSRTLMQQRVGDLLELTGLTQAQHTPVHGFSRGMRQRLGIAQSLMNSPRLLILDEPTSALDPMGRRMVLDLLSELRGKTTVFFSTHLLPDVERVCDRVAIIDAGRVTATGSLGDIRGMQGLSRTRIMIEIDDAARLLAALAHQSWIMTSVDGDAAGSVLITVNDAEEGALRLPALIADLNLRLHRFEIQEPSLEDVFVSLVGAQS